MKTIVGYLVWTRDGHGAYVPFDDPITYRDWALVVTDVQAALKHGRQVRISRVKVPLATWQKYDPPSAAQVRRLRGE